MHCHKSIATLGKLHELHFELLPHHTILQIWSPVTTGCLQTSKECSRERFGSSKEVILETEAHFEAKDKSFDKKRHQIVREALKSVYYPTRRLCW